MMVNRKPILITGTHRSGTTWVGKMIGASSEVGYIHEPFGLMHRPGICSAEFKHWFTYISTENQGHFIQEISKMLHFSYNLPAEIKAIKSYRDGLRMARDYFLFQKYSVTGARPLIKDPIAFFSAEWFAREFNADIVVTIRHPAAFISGLKIKNWEFEFSNFLDQKLLMRDYLSPFKAEIEEFSKHRKSIVDQGILLWTIFYSTIDIFRRKYPDWIFIKHEDLARDPIEKFPGLYQRLGISYSQKEREFIKSYTSQENPSSAPKYKIFGSNVNSSVKRSSKSSVKNWTNRLTNDEIKKIRDHTLDLATQFYTEEDW